MNNDERIDRAVEGLLSDSELEQFQRDAMTDPVLLVDYTERATMHGQLAASREEWSQILSEPELPSVLPQKRSWFSQGIAAAAAAVVAAVVTWVISDNSAPEEIETVATLSSAEGCQWAGSELPTAEGSRLPAGMLSLVEGMATLEFDSGATVTLEAPAALEVTSAMRCRLVEGSVVADVPESAHGFTIDAPDLEVIDLGTRFGLTANQFGQSHVMVFEGEVEVKKAGEENAKLVEEGDTFLNGAKSVATDQETVRSTMIESIPSREGWLRVSTAVGIGKDAFVRRGNAQGSGEDPLMMVKHTELVENNERRGFITFDIREIDRQAISDAEFLLDVEPSGLGFSTLVPDSTFAVYGLMDDAADQWEENELVWNKAPGMNDGGILPDKTRKIGAFEIRRGASASAQIQISTTEFTNFLREDANGLATIIIVRESGEFETQGLVHAFATKEHPNAKAPTLRLKLAP